MITSHRNNGKKRNIATTALPLLLRNWCNDMSSIWFIFLSVLRSIKRCIFLALLAHYASCVLAPLSRIRTGVPPVLMTIVDTVVLIITVYTFFSPPLPDAQISHRNIKYDVRNPRGSSIDPSSRNDSTIPTVSKTNPSLYTSSKTLPPLSYPTNGYMSRRPASSQFATHSTPRPYTNYVSTPKSRLDYPTPNGAVLSRARSTSRISSYTDTRPGIYSVNVLSCLTCMFYMINWFVNWEILLAMTIHSV